MLQNWSGDLTYSENELISFASQLAQYAQPGWCILLEGELGAGKSTFAKAFLRGLEIKKSAEGSPTFPIAHVYEAAKIKQVIHADFYRLKSMMELEQTGIEESIWSPDVLSLIEWPNQLPEFRESIQLKHPFSVCLEFKINPDQPETRIISLLF